MKCLLIFQLARMGAVLLRESWEDYEYIYKANGDKYPVACTTNPIDRTVRSVGTCQTAWRNDPALLAAVRKELGLYLSGGRADLPYYKVQPPPCH